MSSRDRRPAREADGSTGPPHGPGAADERRRRRRAYRRGLAAETLAALALMAKGYRVLGRRVPMKAMEIDLVVARGEIVAFVEVKARRSAGAALDAVGPRGRRRMTTAARQWLALNPRYAGHVLRFDLVAIVPGRWPIHLPNAFAADY